MSLSCKSILLALTFVFAACATTDDGKSITYSLTAKQNYEKGLAELKDENYQEASRFFSFVKQKFPFSKYAVLAELALADTQFERANYQEAIDAYKSFVRLHPTHEKTEDGYVAFRICECYVREMPGDFFLVPPAYEKDQTAVRDALRELVDFVDKYPDSKYLEDARKNRREVQRRLIEHEVYVARFYLDRDEPRAAILRLEGALRRYPDSGREPELLVALGETHLQMGNPLSAKQAFVRVAGEYKATHQAKRAELFLDFIRRRFGESPKDRDKDKAARMDERTKRLLDRGRDHYQAGEFERAARALTPLARDRLPFADVYHMLGVIHHHLGRLEDAQSMFEEALRLNPGYTEAALNLAVTYNELGLYDEAKKTRQQMMSNRKVSAADRLDPFIKGKLANMHADIGKAYDELGLHEEAAAEYRLGITLCPTFIDIRTRLGVSLRSAGNLAAAEREFLQAKRENPRAVDPRLQLGMTYYSAGQRTEAAREWREVLALDPKNRFARLYMRLVLPPLPRGAKPSAG